MAMGFSGSKGGIKNKEITNSFDYVLVFKKLIKNARTKDSRLLNESKIL